jgi:hypothetical protein
MPESNGRVTNRQLHESIKEAKDDSRREVKLWTGIGLVGGQALASLIAAVFTRATPIDQGAWFVHHIATLF